MLLHRYYAGIRKTLDCAANGIFARAKTLPELIDGRQQLARLPAPAGEIGLKRLRDLL